ncbi:MAG: hypothetical protein ABI700_22900, partial [Chloroflexota bacterium]
MPMNRFFTGLWLLLVLGATFAATQAQPTPEEGWMIPLVIVLWIVTAAALIPSRLRRLVGVPIHWLRAHPILYWLMLLVYIGGGLALWIVPYQPTNGHPLSPVEFVYIDAALWGFIYLIAYDAHEPELRAMGSKLGKSKLTGVMVTLTTLLLIFFAGEAYLRIFYITTDGYGFTSMNYWWYRNYGWNQNNSVGFRDHEPLPDDPALTRVAVVGDSFVMGHGINNLDDTFPQKLEKMLGAGYDVNVIAESGWDTDVELYNIQKYPLKPKIVVLSYYLNDMDYLLRDTDRNPDNNFIFPKNPAAAWFIQTFFLPNYIYYDVVQFTSSARSTNFSNDLISVHMDDALWSQQAQHLFEITDWAQKSNVRLIALIWPELAAIDVSTPATKRVGDFFRSQNVEVVDMSDTLRGKTTGELIVNRFDTHPSIEAGELAAEQLDAAITQKDQTP